MRQDDKIDRLKQMLGQVAPEPSALESLIERERPRTTIEEGTGAQAAAMTAETSALEKMSRGRERELTSEETFTLEAIVMPERRPVVLVRKGTYDDNVAPWTHLNDEPIRTRLTPLIRSIGRVEAPNSGLPYGGTGFVVGHNLMMTNRHVARLFADGLGVTIRYRPGDAAVDFLREIDLPEPKEQDLLKVVAVEMIHPYWDMALLRVEGLAGKFDPLPLSIAAPDELSGDDVVVIGYPARDDRSNLAVQDRVFGKAYEVKRFQPGKIRGREGIQSFENKVNALTHDSSTLGGNSGSAVIHVETGRVIGLHFAGVYLKANYAVPTAELARDPKVVDLGLNFVGSQPPTHDWDFAWNATTGGENLHTSPANGAQTMSWTIPIRVDIALGSPVIEPSSRAPSSAPSNGALAVETMKVPKIFGDLEHRTGYDPQFLELESDLSVPMPTLTATGKTAVSRIQGGSDELKYHKFSIIMHAKRRLALYTAANVDWRIEQRLIKGKKPNRKKLTGLGPNDIEKWATDERLADDAQLPDVFYTKDGGAFDKGHLVRRDDVVWGSSFSDMQKANGDTYHTTNCSPQVKSFNQSTQGEDNWGDLEALVEKQTKSEKAVIFSGPVLLEDDPVFEGRDENKGIIRLRIPQRFWKIIVVKEDGDAGAYGFELEQDLSAVSTVEEFAVPSEWLQHMVRIAEIEDKLDGLVDLTWLKQRDRFDSAGGESIRKTIE